VTESLLNAAPQLLEQLADLVAEKLAPLVADELAARLELAQPTSPNGGGMGGWVTLDEFAGMLPPSKTAQTWARWLYAHAHEIEGAHKVGGRWHFELERAKAWIERK